MPIAEYDIARCHEPLDSSVMRDFVDGIDEIFAIAESSEGFIWRHIEDENDAQAFFIDGDPLMIENLSTWQSVADLHHFLYRTHHTEYLKRGREWFSKLPVTTVALWHIEVDYKPSIEEGRERLKYLQKHGDSEYAFGLHSTDFFDEN